VAGASGTTFTIYGDSNADCPNYPPNGVGTYYQTNDHALDASVPTGVSQSSNKYIIPGITYTVEGGTTYNFAGITSPSSTHVARDFEVDVHDPTDPPPSYADGTECNTLTDDGTSGGTPQIRTGIKGHASDAEATQAQYDAIAASDDNRWRITDPGRGDNACFWAQFEIAESPSSISQIDVLLEGYQDADDPLTRAGYVSGTTNTICGMSWRLHAELVVTMYTVARLHLAPTIS